MASALLGRQARLSALTPGLSSALSPGGRTGTVSRSAVSTSSGGILPKPKKTPFGLFRIALVVVPFLYVGTQISKNFAALLEEHDIFVPEDDDDDD
ncbi:essential MCU regulator, mitochondrial [Amphiprion ocellaris]|uniref:Essential MCU regulator, mitochondrial n=1 Tax=Amphiprion ocellaris TaxID=80972 RepID=A0AAQ5XQP0_AMPOC|nr:essential MCU regulator, mitochondrial [Amphiprion ocellaris]